MRDGVRAVSFVVAVLASTTLPGIVGAKLAQAADANAITPEPIPDQYKFPLPAQTINDWIAQGKDEQIRERVWTLLSSDARNCPPGDI